MRYTGQQEADNFRDKLKKLEKKKMTKLKGFIPTTLMLFTLMFGATAANAGIIVGDRTGSTGKDETTCEKQENPGVVTSFLGKVATFFTTGIIVGDRTGIIVGDRTGIIVGDRTCGIIVGDKTGIIVGD